MVATAAHRLHEQFNDRFGDALRSISYYDRNEDEIIFMRSDIESEYENGAQQRIFRDTRLEAIDNQHQESMYAHGSLQCTLRCFEDATELHIFVSETKGIMAAVDAGAIDDLQETIDVCLDAVSE